MESAVDIATEVCFSDLLSGNKPFSAASSVVLQTPQYQRGLVETLFEKRLAPQAK
jgi:hypothetical protein